MPSIHFICRGRLNLHAVKVPVYESGVWDLTPAEAGKLIGGMIYLHESKAEPSYFGGLVTGFRTVTTEEAHQQRIVFTLTAVKEGKGAKWRGADHAMAWSSGIIDDAG